MRVAVGLLALLAPGLAWAGTPKASSELKDSNNVKHPAELAFDGLLATGWGEGEAGAGAGAWIELKLDKATPVKSVSIWPGNLEEGAKSLREFGRPKLVTVTLTTAAGPVTQQVRLLDGAAMSGSATGKGTGPQRVDVPIEGDATAVKIALDEVYEGGVFTDTFIAEIAVNFTGGEVPDAVAKAKKYQGTPQAEAAAAKNKDQIVAWFDKYKAEQFGDRDALAKIMVQAGDGAPFMRDRAKAVPAGFRVQAVPPDEVAIDALLKLKDPNAIPALELASLRVTGAEARDLQDKVEYFYAYQELIGGGNPNVPNWGISGWELGAYRARGEPMPIAIDPWGMLYVADIGNHRVQQVNPDGKAERMWGAKADITNVWFSGKLRYYVSGSKPGDKAGQFVNPVDVAVMPGKDASGFVALDAKGRVQLFDETGAPAISWKVRSDDELEAGVGGEAYVEFIKGKIVVVWRKEVFVYNKDSEELASFDLTDGVPKGSVALKNGKIALIFGDELVMYSLDGFRHGNLLPARDDDPRGEGVEDWDVTVDEKGKLWVVTDTGIAIKYKKPGTVDYSVKYSNVLVEDPRVAAYDDVLFVTGEDKIRRIDALALEAKEQEAAAEAGAGPAAPAVEE